MKRSICLLLIALVLGACGGTVREGSDAPDAVAEPFLLEVVGDDFSFELAGTVPAGPLQIQLENVGKEPHQALVYKLNDGVGYEQYLKSVLEDDSNFPALSRRVGGVNYGISPSVTELHVETNPYEPGTYAMVCFIKETESGKNHYELGMISTFTVE
jgi:hypothetical protein